MAGKMGLLTVCFALFEKLKNIIDEGYLFAGSQVYTLTTKIKKKKEVCEFCGHPLYMHAVIPDSRIHKEIFHKFDDKGKS
jgi:rRNA maturation endonuclease Nob1